ncbi:MAG TPA: alpha/beta hydrolase [Jatrophihabitantaceae bacterium]
MTSSASTPVLFIHGLWMHATSWAPWVDLFADKGYAPIAPGWPGDGETVAATRADPGALDKIGITEVTEHYATVIKGQPSTPIVIGHSFGGLIAQKLLGMGLVRGCVAISPAQFKGNFALPPVQLASTFPILSKPWLRGRTWSHTKDSYAKNFANAVPRVESDEIFEKFTIPAPCRPLFQASVANFTPHSPAAVDTKTARGPLLLLGGSIDRTVPASTVRAAYKIQGRNSGITELEILAGRGHSLSADSGWRDVADKAFGFLARNGL